MKVLFVSAHVPYEPNSYLAHPTLAYGYMATALKRHGHDTEHVDLPLVGNDVSTLRRELEAHRPHLVGVSSVAQTYCQALEVARTVKEFDPAIPVVFGGPHVSFIARECLTRHDSVDFVLMFDCEDSIVALVESLNHESGPVGHRQNVPGLAYRDQSDCVQVTKPEPPSFDLDAYGHPDRAIFDLDAYLRNDYETVVVTARGCPSHCTFCSTQAAGRTYRSHSVGYALQEIETILEAGFTSIYFGDDTIAGDRDRLLALCDQIVARELPIEWTSNIRSLDIDPELLERMRSAGAYRVFSGFETVDPRALKLMGKGQDVERHLRTGEIVGRSGLQLHASFIVGAPGDTVESIERSLEFIAELNPTIATFNPFEPRPGTPMYTHASKFGIHIPDPYWYETTYWLHQPVAYTNSMSPEDITNALMLCYQSFCSNGFGMA